MNEQPRLLPDYEPSLTRRQIRLSDIETDLSGPAPSKAMVESVRRLGVIEAVTLRAGANAGDPYHVVNGRRRVTAARLAGQEWVPATIIGLEERHAATVTLVLNACRAANPVAEYDAISQLEAQGATHGEIARATGLTVGQVRRRLRLKGLDPRIYEALREGRTTQGVAETAARLPASVQQQVAERLAQGARVTRRNLREARQVLAAQGVADLGLGQIAKQIDAAVAQAAAGTRPVSVPAADYRALYRGLYRQLQEARAHAKRWSAKAKTCPTSADHAQCECFYFQSIGEAKGAWRALRLVAVARKAQTAKEGATS